MPDEYQSYTDLWIERYRAANPEKVVEIESRCCPKSPTSYPLVNNTNHHTTAEQSRSLGYVRAEGDLLSRCGINPIVESAILIRKELKLTQASFARCLNISPRTLRDWEQGRRYPSGAALTLLQWAIDRPDYIRDIYELGGV